MNREDTPDEDKLGYEFWNAVEKLPIIKQIKDWNEDSAKKREALSISARSGKEGLLVQGLQAIEDTFGTVVGLPFQALEASIQELSDRTGIDARTLGAVKDIYTYSKSIKASRSGSFYKNVQTTKKNIVRSDIFNPGQITVKPITPNKGKAPINVTPNYEAIINESLLPGNSLLHRPSHSLPDYTYGSFRKDFPFLAGTKGQPYSYEAGSAIRYDSPRLTREEWIKRVRSGYNSSHPHYKNIPSGPKGVSILRRTPGATGNIIKLDSGNEEGVLNSIAESIRMQGINPDNLRYKWTSKGGKFVKGNPATAYFDYVEQYFRKYRTLKGVDRLELPGGTIVKINTSTLTRKIRSEDVNPSESTGGMIQRGEGGAHSEGYQLALGQLKEFDDVQEVSRKQEKSGDVYAGEDPLVTQIALEGHHLAGLDRGDYLIANMPEKEQRKMEYYLTSDQGIPLGDSEFNLAWIDALGVHIPLHTWMDEFTPLPDQATLEKINSIKTFEGRKKFVKQFQQDYYKAMRKIYQLQEEWLDKNFPQRWKSDEEMLMDAYQLTQEKYDDFVNYLEQGDVPFDILQQIKTDEGIQSTKRWTGQGPFSGYNKTLERQTTKIKGTGRLNLDDLFPEGYRENE